NQENPIFDGSIPCNLQVLRPASIVLAEPSIVRKIDNQISSLDAILPHHCAHDRSDCILETDWRTDHDGVRTLRSDGHFDQANGLTVVQLKRHTPGSEAKELLLQP